MTLFTPMPIGCHQSGGSQLLRPTLEGFLPDSRQVLTGFLRGATTGSVRMLGPCLRRNVTHGRVRRVVCQF